MKVAAFYKFMALAEPQQVAVGIKALRAQYPVFGTLIVADEGVNSTIAGEDANIDAFIAGLAQWFGELQPKYSLCAENPFHRFRSSKSRKLSPSTIKKSAHIKRSAPMLRRRNGTSWCRQMMFYCWIHAINTRHKSVFLRGRKTHRSIVSWNLKPT